jgi:hypothetical protein
MRLDCRVASLLAMTEGGMAAAAPRVWAWIAASLRSSLLAMTAGDGRAGREEAKRVRPGRPARPHSFGLVCGIRVF